MRENINTNKKYKILITGGSGFLGRAILQELIIEASLIPVEEIRVLDINAIEGIDDDRITFIRGDVRDYQVVAKATEGVDVVIHSAAIIDWGTHSAKFVYDVNFGGTQNVVLACKEFNVGVLIYTSSLDAVYTGKPLVNIDETIGYPERYTTMYCESKVLSEILVKKENSDTFKTCILRPSDVYGEGDPYHVSSLITMAKTGFYVRLGNGKSKCQHVYVGNMAHAHLLAAKAILEGNKQIMGEAYFITDGPGHNFFTFFDQIVEMAGYKIWPENFWLPKWLAYSLGSISEFIAYLWRPIKRYNPKFSRFAVEYTCTDFTFNSEKAEKDFRYYPKYSKKDAMSRTAQYFRKGMY